jgi:sugar phosphate isomerase/epimerase
VLIYSYGIRAKHEHGFDQPDRFAEFARAQGFRGVQIPLSIRSADECRALRQKLEMLDAYVEGITKPPADTADTNRFDAELRTAKECGAAVLRIVMLGGRRYEVFTSADEYRRFKSNAWESLQLAEPIAARHRMKLAVENHKDYRVAELVDVLQRLSSEFVGACLDTGNNIALLDDPWYAIDTLAPWTFTVHLKDMAVEEMSDGFLLAEVPLGSGFLDIRRIVARISAANPQARFNLEMITRDPLRIPCFTEGYWATMDGVPATDLARSIRLTRQHAQPAGSLVRISPLTISERLALEQQHVEKSVEMMRALGVQS